MNPSFSKAQYLIRRELWENRTGVVWTPVILAIAFSLLILLALLLGRGAVMQVDVDAALASMEKHGLYEDTDEPVKIIDFNSGTLVVSSESDLGLGNWNNQGPADAIATFQHSTVIGFELIALIIAVVYLLGALFNDRKDRSILFWKSLPISETGSVISKLIFAVTVIPFVALICSIPVQFVGSTGIAWAYSLSDNFTFFGALSEFSLFGVLFIHLVLLIIIAIKSLPLYSWLLLASAVSKRSPLLLALIVPIAIMAVEGLIFRTSYFSNFITSLFFADRFNLSSLSSEGMFQVILSAISISFPQLLKIAVVSALFLGGAIWCRKNRYEI